MSTSDNIVIETSTSEINLTSEMDVQLNPISQVGEASATENVETEQVTSISLHENKTDEMLTRLYNMMCSNFNDLNFKFDIQKSEIKEIQSSFKSNFNEMKNEMKKCHNNLIKKCDKLITKLDNLNLVESQLETQKVNSGTQQNAVLNINICKNNHSDNECTDKSNVTSSKIVVLEKGKNDNESIMNDNEMFEFMKSERKLRESILVQGVQGLSLIHI